MPSLSLKELNSCAAEQGLHIVGYCGAEPLSQARQRLVKWQERGFAGELAYMERDPDLLCSPSRLLEGARSVVAFSLWYGSQPAPPREEGYGRVARYAWGRDYHRVLKRRLTAFVERVETQLGSSLQWRVFSDAVPLLERGLAARAGLGFVGKNSMLIRPGIGSYFFLAEVIWDLDLSLEDALPVFEEDCGSCQRCIDQCPSDAIVEPFTVDARKCISYLTIEKRGSLTAWEREALGEWVFGCDICQDVCPFNHTALKFGREPDLDEFRAINGSGGLLKLDELLDIRSAYEFERRFAGTALMRAKREGLLRNAAVVAANTFSYTSLAALRSAAQEDSSAVVREHSLWALGRLAPQASGAERALIQQAIQRGLSDIDEGVRACARDFS